MKFRSSIWISTTILFAAVAIPVRLAAQESKAHHRHYTVTDLGTLGGPNSDFLLGQRVLNNRGTTVGGADTATLDRNYPNVNPLLGFPGYGIRPFIQHGFKWRKGVLTDLGAHPGDNSSYANWVNATGEAVGESGNGLIDPLTGFPEVVAVAWRDGQLINLGTLGGYESEALAVNNSGEVVGFATNAIPDPFPFPFNFVTETLGTQTRAFLWEKGTMRDLGTLGGPDAAAFLVNDRGQVAGNSYTNSTTNPTTGFPTMDPFLWMPCDRDSWDSEDCENDTESTTAKKGKMLDLGTLGGTFGFANDINNRGQVVGGSNLAGDIVLRPYLWDRGKLTDLGSFGGTFSFGAWINERGEIIGVSTPPGNQAILGFLWRNGVLTNLGTVDGDSCSFPRYINSHGQIVGLSDNCQGLLHGFLWEDGGPMVDLNTLIPPNAGVQLADAYNVNDRGEIVALGTLPNGDQHAVLLKPCDSEHAGTEGCDYDPVDSSATTRSTPAVNSQAPKLDPAILSKFARRIHN